MRIETVLGGTVVAVLAVTMLLTALVPGVIASQETDEGVPPGDVAIREVTIASGGVSGATATLAVEARIEHRRGPSENVTVEFRAIDAESGLVEATGRVEVGTVTVDGQRRVRTNLSVPREGGYRVEVIVFQGASQEDAGSKTVAGVGSLVPAYARTGVEFHRFRGIGTTGLPVIEYAIADQADGDVTLDVSAYLTNTGDDPEGGLRLELKARQADSGIVAAETTVDLGTIRPGRTARPAAELAVPDGYNYYLDAILWKDGVIVGSARAAANLNPDRNVTVNRSRASGGIRVGDFVRGEDGNRRTTTARERRGMDTGGGGGPGFGVGVAAVALLGAGLLAARRRNHE